MRLGTTIVAISAVIATTTSISSSVKPEACLPAPDILRLARPARRFVLPERVDVDFAVLPRVLIDVSRAPRVLQRAVLLEVGPVPVRRGRRRGDEAFETFLLRRIAPDVEAVQLQRRHHVLDLHFR